jgi:hypothetical protein
MVASITTNDDQRDAHLPVARLLRRRGVSGDDVSVDAHRGDRRGVLAAVRRSHDARGHARGEAGGRRLGRRPRPLGRHARGSRGRRRHPTLGLRHGSSTRRSARETCSSATRCRSRWTSRQSNKRRFAARSSGRSARHPGMATPILFTSAASNSLRCSAARVSTDQGRSSQMWDAFTLTMPVWEKVMRTLVVSAAIAVLVRLPGTSRCCRACWGRC